MVDFNIFVLVISFLFYLTIKALKNFISSKSFSSVVALLVLFSVMFNIWLELYASTLKSLISSFELLVNAVPVVLFVVYAYLERKRFLVEKEKKKVEEFFSKYVSPKIVNELVKQEKLGTGGRRKIATIIFTDVRGFTSFSESTTPEDVVASLNEHFNVIASIALKHDGTILKYIGDAAMIAFNVPIEQEDFRHKAILSAIDIQKGIEEMNRRREAEGKRRIEIGIGMATGPLVEGNIGSEHYMDYTVIGDTVNLASRLNGVAAAGEIVVCEETAKGLKDLKAEGPLTTQVKGKKKEVTYYKVIYK